MNAAFAAAGIDAVYVPMETRDAAQFLAAADDVRDRRRERHGAAQDGVGAARRRDRCGRARHRRRQYAETRRGRGWGGRNFDVDGFLAPLDAARS